MRRIATVVVLTALVLSGCAWTHQHGDAGQSGVNPAAGLDVADVVDLHEIWRSRDAVRYQALADADQIFAVQSPDAYTQRIEVFAADGSTGCGGTPRTCDPVWVTAAVAVGNAVHISEIGHPLLTDAYLVVPYEAAGQFVVSIYDRKGLQGCTGSGPRVCAPLGTAALFPHGPGNDSVAALTDGGGMIYAVGWYDSVQGSAPIAAIRLADLPGCASSSACAPVWRASTNGSNHAPAFADGRLYVRTALGAAAYDAAGVEGCGSGICSPLWTYEYTDAAHSVTVAHGRLIAAGPAAALDAAGNEGCGGVPRVCRPIWQADGSTVPGPFGPVVVTDDRVYVAGSSAGTPGVQAYDLDGLDGCTASAPRTCAPLWHLATTWYATNLVATGSVGIVGGTGGGAKSTTLAFRLDGAGCPPAAQGCTPLWTSPLHLGAPVAVAGGRMVETYINDPMRVFAAN